MSRTLTLIDAGWETILALAARGQKAEAFAQLTRLLARPDVPTSLAVEGNRFAGELAIFERPSRGATRCGGRRTQPSR